MKISYSFIIPVYNRPNEIEELLMSFKNLQTNIPFEVVIVEDGSTETSEHIVRNYDTFLSILYLKKNNSGPGDSRNYGMQKASGNYFIVLDSDVVLPSDYLNNVDDFLKANYVDCFGGPDEADKSFTNIQKAINFVMTSFLTTGGIRGRKKAVKKFEPRSFNMGISKKAFEATKGFGKIHPGEDPDLAIRIKNAGFKTCLIPNAYVYHKRRISWSKFYQQVHKFGMVRVILNNWHPETSSPVFWFPSFFTFSFFVALLLLLFQVYFPVLLFVFYFLLIGFLATLKTKSIYIGFLSIRAAIIQFFGYGLGFLKSTYYLRLLRKEPKEAFPKLFFK
ncbi:glycosyltransferase [Mesonia aquimarina]|uniref:glycosyltransferase n=1 Tax=Mesonia aquimarina TaxID=1504967 RepID=UPI000EF5E13A|nr:glycosyltransferase [Mesonia aquimarina]